MYYNAYGPLLWKLCLIRLFACCARHPLVHMHRTIGQRPQVFGCYWYIGKTWAAIRFSSAFGRLSRALHSNHPPTGEPFFRMSFFELLFFFFSFPSWFAYNFKCTTPTSRADQLKVWYVTVDRNWYIIYCWWRWWWWCVFFPSIPLHFSLKILIEFWSALETIELWFIRPMKMSF